MAGPFDNATLKHLEFLQAVIARLGNNGFVIKGWAVTVAGAFFGFAVESGNGYLSLASVATTALFWGLDGYFLYCERLFRRLYDRVRRQDPTVPPLYMAASERSPGVGTRNRLRDWTKALTSPTLVLLYGGMWALALVFALLLGGPDRGMGQPAAPSSSQDVMATMVPTQAPQPSEASLWATPAEGSSLANVRGGSANLLVRGRTFLADSVCSFAGYSRRRWFLWWPDCVDAIVFPPRDQMEVKMRNGLFRGDPR